MKDFNLKTSKSSNRGITLIALVITIIVLLILAGITIAMIAGQDSAPAKAVEARNANKVGAAKDAAALLVTDYMQQYYNGKYVGNEAAAKNATDVGEYISTKLATAVTKGEHTFQVVSGELTVSDSNGNAIVTGTINSNGTITWNGEATNAGNSGNNSSNSGNSGNNENNSGNSATPTVANSKPASANAQVTALSTTDNTTIEDTLGNEIIVPVGFGMAYESGENVEDGVVIEDATNGNQFVWVPVGNGIKVTTDVDPSGTIDIELSRYEFDGSGNATKRAADYVIEDYHTETASNTVARKVANDSSKIEFVEQAKEKGGYYIARYEAGVAGTTDNNSLSTQTATDGSVKPLSKAGVGVWNYISRSNALTVSQAMYSNNTDKFKSDLISSYAWDTAIVFIEKCGTNSNYANQGRLQDTLTTTGNASNGTNNDVQCNIYDMAGNILEWSTEYSSESGYPCVRRGGSYGRTDNYTALRCGNSVDASSYFAFRPTLYIM